MQFSISFQQAIILLSLLSGLHSRVDASPIVDKLNLRSDFEDEFNCVDEDPAETNDAPTGNNPPGIGVEFQTGAIMMISDDCSPADVASAKGKIINDRKGDHWMLTADTMNDGELYAEYILNGKTIKLNDGTAKQAAKSVANDVIDWNPYADGKEVSVEDSPCRWTIKEPEEQTEGASYNWQPQVTAPLPLQSLNNLFGKYLSGGSSYLLPRIRQKPMVHVTKDFFQSSPNGIRSDAVKEEALGFLSLVLSYAKAADPTKPIDSNVSPKELTNIMPRTDFTSIYNTVKSSLPGNLYELVKILGCYKNSGDHLELDSTFCSGTIESPTPTGQMDRQRFGVQSEEEEPKLLTVKDWIKSLQNSAPDALTKLDRHIDGSIGGLGASFENILGSQEMAPLFEFRRLARVKTGGMEEFVSNGEKEIISYHQEL